jgi:hypothetical protein
LCSAKFIARVPATPSKSGIPEPTRTGLILQNPFIDFGEHHSPVSSAAKPDVPAYFSLELPDQFESGVAV